MVITHTLPLQTRTPKHRPKLRDVVNVALTTDALALA